MKQRLKVFGIYSLFWIGFFILARLLFLLYEYSLSFELGFKEWVLIFINGFRMDISTAGYIMAIVGLLFTFTSITDGTLLNKILKPFTVIFLILTSCIIVADLELYSNWGFRMDSTPLLYITKPKEAMASTELWLTILLFILVIGLVLLGSYVYNKLIREHVFKVEKARIYTPFLLILLTGSMILPVRGGIGIAPMNSGMVYFSENRFSNHAAINVVWNVMSSLFYRSKKEKAYTYLSNSEVQQTLKSLSSQSGNTTKLLNKERPNVLLLILESFSSKVIASVGGKWDAAPNFNKLAEEGLLFTNFYANGDRSDKGMVSILSGYPAQPTLSIIKDPSKSQSLPSIYHSFEEMGYTTSFYYGGNIDFANMRSYFYNANVDNFVTDKDFEAKLRTSKWGVHDEHLFNKLYDDLVKKDSLFFDVVFTLSSHEPYDVPMEPIFEGNDRTAKFLNSVYYTDSCLYDFIGKLKKTEIWENTLIIMVADHGTPRPGKSRNYEVEKFQIPMLWTGGALNDSIKIYNRVASQIDIPATVLNQFSVNTDQFTFSKDLFKENHNDFAYYVFNDGFGFITDSTKAVYDNVGNKSLINDGNAESDLLKGKAMVQYVSEDYLRR